MIPIIMIIDKFINLYNIIKQIYVNNINITKSVNNYMFTLYNNFNNNNIIINVILDFQV